MVHALFKSKNAQNENIHVHNRLLKETNQCHAKGRPLVFLYLGPRL